MAGKWPALELLCDDAPGGASGVRASSMCTIFSLRSWKAARNVVVANLGRMQARRVGGRDTAGRAEGSCSAPAVVHILSPLIVYVSPGPRRPVGVALQRTEARLEPACGSLRAIVPMYAPERRGDKYSRFSLSQPCASRRSAAHLESTKCANTLLENAYVAHIHEW